MTLSPPVRIVALAGLLLALAGAGFLEYPRLKDRFASKPAPVRTLPVRTAPTPAPPAKPAPPAAAAPAVPGLPPAVRHALAYSRSVVAFVYSPASPDDRALLAEVRAGARTAHATLVPLDVEQDAVAAAVFAWTGRAADPEVLVVRRPGRVVFAIRGATDRTAVAQAVATTRR